MKQINIIGGGLAGLTLGIALRQHNVPVAVLEAGGYPRHRVCGEFISGAGLEVLRASGLDQLFGNTVSVAKDCAFYSGDRLLTNRALPEAAITVSRFHLDAALAKHFRALGGWLHEGSRWRGTLFEEGYVNAMGRRAQPIENGWRWFGLKVHARDVELAADLEMHLMPHSYVGLCRLASGEVNVCGLFRRKIDERARGASMDWLRGGSDSILFRRLERADFDTDSFCAIAGLSLAPQPIYPIVCRVGDALTMIPPITGNGMSMAFESAQLVVEPLLAYAKGNADWDHTTARIADILRNRFVRRLRWAGLFHRALFSRFNWPLLPALLRSEFGWRLAFAATR